MTLPRMLTGLAITVTATATLSALAPAAQATAGSARAWGPYSAPGKAAQASGTLTATGEDHGDLPTADLVRVSGKLSDNTRGPACGWAVFRVTYRSGSNLPFREHPVRHCSNRKPKSFSFKYRDVYQVELKVCSERKAAKPSLTCLYAGTWKTLYLSK
ncbi:hypothetical protein FAF44_21125 [Nonomuraea sp. MG754425]|uniref:hypothetical protein n=1 Tax=Nonomuraea sp. MG754425 TaxID=2570319 RepID=UPI001F201460|nr:hypothetical protein [Nonomuraea sp. MG754425]MCF6470877.1 hypothetical protein [Nonomuraea sp. MG754425]